jgi:hypothetical protein
LVLLVAEITKSFRTIFVVFVKYIKELEVSRVEELKEKYLKAKEEYEKASKEWEQYKRKKIREIFEGFSYDKNNQFAFDKSLQSTLYKILEPYNIENKKLYQILKEYAIIYEYDDKGNLIITKPKTFIFSEMR